MNNKTARIPQRWLNPSAALSRFKPPSGVATSIATTERQHVRYGVRVGGIGLLIGQNTVSEVLEQTLVYPLPNTPSWMLGLVNLRGNLVPVFDLKLCLGLEGTTQERQYLLVLDEGNNAVGFFIEKLPLPVSEGRKLVRPPPLPMALQGHGVEAYSLHNDIWVEFNHREFFQSLTMQTTATA